jgi:hypothetical protein
MGYSGPEGEGSLKVTLRVASATSYRLEAVDPVGRSLWLLATDGRTALMIDDRAHVACHPGDRVEVPGLPLGAFPLAALPRLLLGQLPAEVAAGQSPAAPGGTFKLDDESGRHWTGTLRDHTLDSWTLWAGSQPAAWYRRLDDGGAVLSVPGGKTGGRGVQIRWHQVLAERLSAALPPPVVPGGYRELSDCHPVTAPGG